MHAGSEIDRDAPLTLTEKLALVALLVAPLIVAFALASLVAK